MFYVKLAMGEQIKLLFSLFFLSYMATSSATVEERRPYIVHMDKSSMPAPFSSHESWYMSALLSLSEPSGIAPTHLYTYNHVLHGFSAVLSPSQLKQLERMPGHIATYPESYGQLLTTHTPKFLGLNRHRGLWQTSSFGNDTIIGILDTGIWPESRSFNDRGMPPVPERWRGKCETGTEFNSSNCNRKLIGARSFSKGLKERGLNISLTEDYDSPRDYLGHGSHTTSTAAGTWSPHVDYFGYAEGTAVGLAPMARVAMYKVLFLNDTLESAATDVLAGMDQAIEDGVDLMSLSIGFPSTITPFYEDIIALGAFAAMEKGIFVSCAAGNRGPHGYTILNGAPWITTVGAGTIDRDYVALITLGDGETSFHGRSIYPESLFVSGTPLYYGDGNTSKENCEFGSLDPKEVMGKIIFCNFDGEGVYEMNRTGARAAIIATDKVDSQFLRPDDFYLPFVVVSLRDGEVIKEYIRKAVEPPTVDIVFQITVLGAKPAPQVAYFSSRGPNRVSPGILKPDILAPGVNVLAAWVPNKGFTPIGSGSDYLVTEYVLLSGTSMASPHVVGVAALLRSYHRDWSPAAIRSALMTTADIIDNTDGPILDMTRGFSATPLDFGGGHINPNKAMDPGLVYDADVQDYIDFLCGLNYTSDQMSIITRKPNYKCAGANLDLNYPSFMVILNNTNSSTATFSRVLTSVSDSPATYHAVVQTPTGMKVILQPETLSFGSKYSKQGFTMTIEIDLASHRVESDYIVNYGYLTWYESNGTHVVRSPIVSAFAP